MKSNLLGVAFALTVMVAAGRADIVGIGKHEKSLANGRNRVYSSRNPNSKWKFNLKHIFEITGGTNAPPWRVL